MSDHFLVVIPSDPKADLPERAEALRQTLATIAGAGESRVKEFGRIQFIDCGENFESILCPSCRTELETGWWRHQMDHCWDAEAGFDLHAHALPCCSVPLSLDKLVYAPPQGFARWMVSARAGNRGPLTGEEIARLEAIAGLRLRGIAQMY